MTRGFHRGQRRHCRKLLRRSWGSTSTRRLSNLWRIVRVDVTGNEAVDGNVVVTTSAKVDDESLVLSLDHTKGPIIRALKRLPVRVVTNENKFGTLETRRYVDGLTAVSRSRHRPQSGNIMTEAPKKVIGCRLEFSGHHEIPRNS